MTGDQIIVMLFGALFGWAFAMWHDTKRKLRELTVMDADAVEMKR